MNNDKIKYIRASEMKINNIDMGHIEVRIDSQNLLSETISDNGIIQNNFT